MNLLRGIVIIAAVTLTLAPVSAQKDSTPALADLLRLGGEYVDAYSTKVSGTALEEQMILSEQSSGQLSTPERIASDLVIVKINADGQVIGLRDPYSIDTKALRERQPRIVQALAEPTIANWQVVEGYVREHANLLGANVVVWFSDPMLALRLIAGPNQSRLTYALEGRKKMNGVQVYGVSFKEPATAGAKHLLDLPDDPRSSGRFWIDPATGAIHMTELWTESDTDTARIEVTYAPEATLGMLLPHAATGTFETREPGSGGSIGPGATKVGFDVSAAYSHASHAPIDLSHIAR